MTDQEKIEQRVRLGVEVEMAAKDLAHERERALQLADHLELWAKWLRNHATKQPSASDFVPEQNPSDLALRAGGIYAQCLNYNTMLATEANLRAVRQKVSNLELRRMQLDTPPTFRNC